MKNHNSLIGFNSFPDFLNTTFGLRNKIELLIVSLLGGITSFITKYVWDDASAVYFLAFLIAVDFITALYRSIKTKTLTSKRLPRAFVVCTAQMLMLAIGWNTAKFIPMLSFLPGMLYFGFVTTTIISISENLVQTGVLQKSILTSIKDLISNVKKNKSNN